MNVPGQFGGVAGEMLSIKEVQTYVRDIVTVQSYDELEARLDDTLRRIGFVYYALVHHVNVVSPPLGFVKVTNYPLAWREDFTTYRYYADDPTRVACQMTASPFLWNRLDSIIKLTRRQHEFMTGARLRGLGLGYTIPIHVPGRVSGSVNLATGPEVEIPRDALPIAHHIAVFTFEAARRIAEEHAALTFDPVHLSNRQMEVLSLVAKGKSNWATAQILGIGERTVKEHLQEAMMSYGVSSRTELVVRSLFDGNLSFADVIPFTRNKLN